MRLLFLDYSTKLETVHDLTRKGRGGMIASLFAVPDALSRLGHDVEVLSDIQEPGTTNALVRWVNEPRGAYDVLVCNRGVGKGYAAIEARRRVLWTHDLPHAGFIPEPKLMNAFHRVVFMSRYAERVWRAFCPSIRKGVVIPNGVDKSLFKPLQKDQNYLIYASAPNRGLKRLPLIHDGICGRLGRSVKLKAFSNLAKQHPGEVRDEKADHFALIYKEVADSDVTLCDPIPQAALARQLGRAALMLMPTDYPEICSNIILQSLACGTPVVTTGNLGSAGEWIRDGRNGILTRWQPVDYMVYQAEIIRRVTELLKAPRVLARMQRRAARTDVKTWTQIGRLWHKMLVRL